MTRNVELERSNKLMAKRELRRMEATRESNRLRAPRGEPLPDQSTVEPKMSGAEEGEVDPVGESPRRA